LDQRLPFLRGGEQILVKGMHPVEQSLRFRLPALGAHASIRLPGKAPLVLALKADTLWIDADRMLACLTWRGLLALTGELASDASAPAITVGLAPCTAIEEVLADPPAWRERSVRASASHLTTAAPKASGMLGRPSRAPEIVNLSPLVAGSFDWRFEPLGDAGPPFLPSRSRSPVAISRQRAPVTGPSRHPVTGDQWR